MLLEKLTNAFGVCTCEDEVRNIIREEIKDHVDEIIIDVMGNIIATKNSNASGKHICLSAHMDEVGLIIHNIDDSGLLKFKTWGISDKVLQSKVVSIGNGENKIKGVIGGKPIHLQGEPERKKVIPIDQLYIDIGAKSKEEALKYVSIGDCAVIDSKFEEFGDNKYKSRAFDDRVGCDVIVDVLKSDTKAKITACFVVQEELGIRGSVITANRVKADIVLNLEGTISADTLVEKGENEITTLGNGPVLSLKDKGSVYLKEYRDMVINVAEKNNIPYQFRKSSMGGTDALNYHRANSGMPVVNISVGCRYIHTPVSIADKNDIENTKLLVKKFIEEYKEA